MVPPGTMNYELLVFRDSLQDEVFAVLHEPQPVRHWGNYVFRWRVAEPFVVEVPRPLLERNVYEFGISTFHRPAASALLLAGAHPRANYDGSADVIRLSNKANLLNLTRQVLMRETEDRPLLVVQVRAIQSPTKADVVMATDRGNIRGEATSPLKKELLREFMTSRMSCAFVDGSVDTAGYEVSNGLRSATADAWQNKEVATLWLSPEARMLYRDQSDNLTMATKCAACNIEVTQGELHGELAFSAPKPTGECEELVAGMKCFREDPDVIRLAEIRRQFGDWKWRYLQDRRSGQAFFLISRDDAHMPLVVRAMGNGQGGEVTIRPTDLNVEAIDRFIGSRNAFLRFEGSRS